MTAKRTSEGDDPGTTGSQVKLTPEQRAELGVMEKAWAGMNRHERREALAKIRKYIKDNGKKG